MTKEEYFEVMKELEFTDTYTQIFLENKPDHIDFEEFTKESFRFAVKCSIGTMKMTEVAYEKVLAKRN